MTYLIAVRAAFVLTVMPALFWSLACSAATPSFTGVEIGGGVVPTAINASGQIAGNGSAPGGGSVHAVLYSGGTVTDLGTLGGTTSQATGINASGQIVGYSTLANGLIHAFLYSGGVMSDLGVLPGGAQSYATAINDAGQIAGWSDTKMPGTSFPQPDHAFIYSGGVMTDLGNISATGQFANFSHGTAINASGQVAGWGVDDKFNTHAIVTSGGKLTDLGTLGGSESRATGINDSGVVVGWSNTTGDLATHAFKYAGAMTDLGAIPGNNNSEATAIGKDGTIIGGAINISQPAFIYTDAIGLVQLSTLVSGTGWNLGKASAINSAGQILASGSNSTVFATYFLLTPGAVAPPGSPAISSALTGSGAAGSAFNYTITASNSPTSFGATGLPAGLSVNTATGAITGTPSAAGTSNVTLSATNASGTGTAAFVLTVSAATGPGFTSPPAPGSTTGAAGVPVTFSAATASGASINWNFGDGTPTAAGATVSHIFTTSGTFNITVQATDSTGTTTQTLSYTVAPAVIEALTISKASIKLNFAKTAFDSISFSGSIAIPQGFNPAGAIAYFQVGGVIKTLVLTSKGSAVSGGDSIKIALKSKKGVVQANPAAKYNVNFKNGSFASTLAGAGLTNSDTKGGAVMVPFTFSVNGIVYDKTQSMTFTAKKDKAGTAK